MSDDLVFNLLVFFRWVHILAGITWIGHLYFFNFVNAPFQAVLAKELKPQVNPELIHRALWWFRWGAMVTFLMGWTLFLLKYGHQRDNLIASDGSITERAIWILFGGTLGTIMWFNVWFIIWPSQKLILGWVKAAQSPPEMAALVKKAGLFSRINTYLSGPMLFGMVMANNYYSFNLVVLLVGTAFSLLVIWGMLKHAGKVGKPPVA